MGIVVITVAEYSTNTILSSGFACSHRCRWYGSACSHRHEIAI